MAGTALALAFVASLAPSWLAWLPGERWALVGAWQTPLALLPWLALAGLPRPAREGADRPCPGVLVACLLPALALAVAGDLRNGRSAEEVARLAAIGVTLCALLGLASARARGSWIHALLWILWVPGSAALLLAGEAAHLWESGSGPAAQLLRASPLAWATGAASQGAAAAAWGALLGGLALQLTGLPRRARGELAA